MQARGWTITVQTDGHGDSFNQYHNVINVSCIYTHFQ